MENLIKKLTDDQISKLILESNNPMNSLNFSIPYSYAINLVGLNWNDILFAVKNDFLTHLSAVENAITEIEKNEKYSQSVLDLACLSPEERVHPMSIYPYINNLVKLVSNKEKSQTEDKIMYILLSWIYEEIDSYFDPLKIVEIIYDDFGHPEIISSFVRYMPSDQPDLGSEELNRERLYKNWKEYLEKQAQFWKK